MSVAHVNPFHLQWFDTRPVLHLGRCDFFYFGRQYYNYMYMFKADVSERSEKGWFHKFVNLALLM